MFDDTVGSAVLLSVIDMSVVFLVLVFLMCSVQLTRLGLKLAGDGERDSTESVAGDPEVASAEAAPGDGYAVSELELVAVQAAAIAAYEANRDRAREPFPVQPESRWRLQGRRPCANPPWK